MGSYFSHPAGTESTENQNNSPGSSRVESKKRSHDAADLMTEEDSLLHTPKKKKLKSTTDYIYQVLFIDGENSDVTISALGKKWSLHKLYLKQCGYFESMFNGSWKESEAAAVTLDIPDKNIDADALSVAFGCLYRDDLTIEPVQVVPVVAAACLLQLDGLMQQCAVIMNETISSKTVCEYYGCSRMYGLEAVKDACFAWLENNVMCKQSKSLLRNISCDLMRDLVDSPNLFVMQVEMDVYNLLKRWVFLQLVPWWNGSFKNAITKQADTHLKEVIRQEFGSGSSRSFLETSLGRRYRKVFSVLRYQHIIIDLTSTNLLTKDRIIPQEWLVPYFKAHWLLMLNVEQGDDMGPKAEDIDDDVFLRSSLRCARVLNRDIEHQWRWIGFNYGIDLVVMYIDRTIILKRNCGNQSRLLANHVKRHVMVRLTVSSVNDLGHVTFNKTGDIVSHDFVKDGEVLGMAVDKRAAMPLRISLNILYYTPKPELHTGNVLHIPLQYDKCRSCRRRGSVAAISPSSEHSAKHDIAQDVQAESDCSHSTPLGTPPNTLPCVGTSDDPPSLPADEPELDHS